MLRLGGRLISLGCETLKKNNVIHTNLSSLRLTQSLAQMTTSDNARSMEVPTPQVVFLIKSVLELGFKENEIKFAIQKQPGLLKKSPTHWNSVLGTFLDFGFGRKAILSILEKWPQVLSLKKSELDTNLETWFRCNLGDELTLNVLTTHPSLLQVHHVSVEKRIKQYQAYFESKKRVGKLLLLAPNTLEEGWSELFDKLNYLNEFCTEKSEVVSSGALAHSALHIRARHEFLIRAGIYKIPGKEFKRKLCKNPTLTNIVNTSDKDFAFKVAGLSLLEYEVFLDMFEKEYEESKKQELDSDDDEEELNKLAYAKHHKPPRRC